jgi:hypothetical protein
MTGALHFRGVPMTRGGWPWLALLTLSACTQAQRPYSFRTPAPEARAMGTVARVLADEGYEVQHADESLGVIQTKWKESTDSCYHPGPDARTAYVVRRYTAMLAPSGGASDVTLRLDAKCCPDTGIPAADLNCIDLEGAHDAQQKELDALGARLQAALASPPTPSGAGGSGPSTAPP